MRTRPRTLWLLAALVGLLAIGGFDGGLSFLFDPNGAALGAKLSWLEHTPVSDFFLPGLFLAGVYGVGGLIVLVGLIWRVSPGPLHRLDRWSGHHWAWFGSIALGTVLVLWIAYELVVMPEWTWLQPVLIVVGLGIVGLPQLPSLVRWYGSEPHRSVRRRRGQL